MTAHSSGPRGTSTFSGGAEISRRKVRMVLPVTDPSVRLARHATRVLLAAWRLAHVEEAAVLIVSELVTNAVRHAADIDVIALELQATRTWLRIEIQDTDRRWPQPRIPDGFEESGFGLVLVDALASKWG